MKKALSAVLAVVLVLSVCFSVPMIASAGNTEDLTFVLNDAGTGYIVEKCATDASGVIEIPATHNPYEEENVTPVTYTVNFAVEGEGGTISATAKTSDAEAETIETGATVPAGATVVFTVAPEEGKVATLKIGEEAVTLTENTYTIASIDASVTATATFADEVVNQAQMLAEGDVGDTGNTGDGEQATTYTATVDTENIENGTVTAAPAADLKETDKVTVTVTPNAGYELATLTYTVTDGEPVDITKTNDEYSFEMPANNVTINATFTPIDYTVTVETAHGTVTVNKEEAVHVGDDVTITIGDPESEEYIFRADSLKVNDGAVTFTAVADTTNKFTFKMPAGNVTVKAQFILKELPVVGIAADAFKDCANITSISIPASVATIGDNAFAGCSKLTAITVDDANTAFEDVNGVLFNKGVTTLVAFPVASTAVDVAEDEEVTYTIPASVTTIAKGAFASLGAVDCVFTEKAELTIADGNEALTEDVKTLHYDLTDHKQISGDKISDPTCTTKGEEKTLCEVCGKDMGNREIPTVADAHVKVVDDDPEKTYAATCTEDGQKTWKCSEIGCTWTDVETLDKLGHDMPENWTITEGSTCTEGGTMTKTCQRTGCNHTETAVIAAAGHKYSTEKVLISAATCTTTGEEDYQCTVCKGYKHDLEENAEVTVIPVTHTWSAEKVVTKEATCTEAGSKVIKCTTCGAFDETTRETIEAGHTPSEWIDKPAATCTEKGWHYKECTVCKEVLAQGETNATGHHEGDWVMVKVPTCGAAGEMGKYCVDCGIKMSGTNNEFVLPLEPLGHTEESYTWAVTTPATCSAKGVETGVCADCGHETTRDIPMLEHTWAETATQDIAATCTTVGKKSIKCTVCNAKQDGSTEDIPVIAHDIDITAETTTKTEATHFATGKYVGICRTCAKNGDETAKEVIIPKTPCKFTTTVEGVEVPATAEPIRAIIGEGEDAKRPVTCTDAGYVAVYCTIAEGDGEARQVCQHYDEATLEEIPALGHDIDADDWTETLAPKCGVKGSKQAVCGRTGCPNAVAENPVIEEVAALEHDLTTEKVQVVAPTCKDEGVKAIKCQRNGCTYHDEETEEPIAKLTEHAWVADSTLSEAVTQASCEFPAYQTRPCTLCGEVKVPVVGSNPTGHAWEQTYTIDKEPTCEKDGEKSIHCAVCDKIDETTVTVAPATGHKFAKNAETGVEIDWTVTKAATCEEDGSHWKTCENTHCDYANGHVVKTIDKLGHYYADEYTGEDPTCTEDGWESRKCIHDGCKAETGRRILWATGHDMSTDYKEITPATCTAEGKEALYCKNGCGLTENERAIEKIPHTYSDDNWTEVTPAGCETAGTKTVNCEKCNTVIEGTIDALGHDFSKTFKVDLAAGCESVGSKSKHCSRCDAKDEVTEIPATGHNVASWTTNDATCTEAGSKTGTCSNTNCSEPNNIVTEVIPAKGHNIPEENYTDKNVEGNYKAPTCVEDGWWKGTCTVCGVVNNPIKASGHDYGEWDITKPATCTEDGSRTKTCKHEACKDTEGYRVTETIANLGGHKEVWVLETAATCGTAGNMYKKCSVCKIKIEGSDTVIPATGKHPADKLVEEVITAATCTTPGTKKITCEACKTVVDEDAVIPATDHKFTDWHVFVDATCTTPGIKQSACTVCLTVDSKPIDPLGHDETDYIFTKNPTCDETGSKHKECTRCDWKSDDVTVDPLGHKYTNGNTCATCGDKILEYTETENGIVITKYNDTKETLDVPTKVDGKVVVGIAAKAFLGNTTLTAVTLPDTVTSIGDYAFANTGLKAITLSENVTEIGKNALGFTVTVTLVPAPEEEPTDTPTDTPAGDTGSTDPVEPEQQNDAATEGETTVEMVEEITEPVKVPDFVIYGKADSAAQTWAAQGEGTEDDVTFVALGDVYSLKANEEDDVIISENDGIFVVDIATTETDINTLVTEKTGYTKEVKETGTYNDDTKFFGTGTKVIISDAQGNVVDTIEIAIQGDVNGDGVCDVLDCMLLELARNTNNNVELEGAYLAAGDYNGKDGIEITDVEAIVNQAKGEDPVADAEAEEDASEPSGETPSEPSNEDPSNEDTSNTDTSNESSENQNPTPDSGEGNGDSNNDNSGAGENNDQSNDQSNDNGAAA